MTSTLESNELVERLFARINYEKRTRFTSGDFKLNNLIQFLKRLGDPHLKCPVVHVAGTKGKGSVCAFVGSILSQAGYRVGIYTSPHLERINQRIRFDGNEIENGDLIAVLEELQPVIAQMDAEAVASQTKPLTFFEVITAASFQYFANMNADLAVLEVGMGGRLDSTNVCQPDVCVITNISLDHTRQLGATTDKIAAEKAGILKPGVPVICGELQTVPKQVIHDIAADVGCPIYQLESDFGLECTATQFDFRSNLVDKPNLRNLIGLKPSMAGTHQQSNAAIAIAACQVLIDQDWKISETDIREGVAGAQLPGRSEVIKGQPTFIVDIAHNEASTTALTQTLQNNIEGFNESRSRTLIFAASREKDVKAMLRPLLPLFDRMLITKFVDNPRGREAEEILKIAHELKAETSETQGSADLQVIKSPKAALEMAISDESPDHIVCITGSAFLVAELRPLLLANPRFNR